MIFWNASSDGKSWQAPGRVDLPRIYDPDPNFELGVTEPTWANSGCRIPEANLTVFSGTELVTTADNQVIEGLLLNNARIWVRHSNVTIRDCIIRIGDPTGRLYIHNHVGIAHRAAENNKGLRVEFVTIDPVNAKSPGTSYPATGYDQFGNDAQVSGIYITGGFVYRCAIRNVTDGIMPDVSPGRPEPVHAWGNFIETRRLDYDYEQQGATDKGTHNDCIQIAGGVGHTAIGNSLNNVRITGTPGNLTKTFYDGGQCIVLTSYKKPPIQSFEASYNWMRGGYTQFACNPQYDYDGPGLPDLKVVGNRHGGTCRYPYLLTRSSWDARRKIEGNVSLGLTWDNGTKNIPAGTVFSPATTATSSVPGGYLVYSNNSGTGVPS